MKARKNVACVQDLEATKVLDNKSAEFKPAQLYWAPLPSEESKIMCLVM